MTQSADLLVIVLIRTERAQGTEFATCINSKLIGALNLMILIRGSIL